MDEIKAKFEETLKTGVSTYVAFRRTIKGMKLSKTAIRSAFTKLVDSKDYVGVRKDTLLDDLYGL